MAQPSRELRGRRYSPEEIERGLAELAMCGGSAARASRQLAAKGLPIPKGTLLDWRNHKHAERYERIQTEVIPQVHAKLAEESEQLATEYGRVERKTLQRFEQELPNLKAAEAAGAVRNLATSRGIAIDKASTIRGRPPAIVEHRTTPDTLYAQLRHLGIEVPTR